MFRRIYTNWPVSVFVALLALTIAYALSRTERRPRHLGPSEAHRTITIDAGLTGAIGARPTFGESHVTAWADTTGEGRPDAQIMKTCGPPTSQGIQWCYFNTVDTTPAAKHSLIVLLPGRGDNITHMMNTTFPQLQMIAWDLDAIVVGVPGKTSTSGDNSYNAGAECCWPPLDGPGPDDDTYIDAVVQKVIDAGWPVDPKKIYIIGHSAGAWMAFREACDHAGRYAAIFMMSGGGIRPGIDAACAAGTFSAAHFHGTLDSALYDNNIGDVIAPNTVEYVSVEVDRVAPSRPATSTQFATQNACAGTLLTTTVNWLNFDADVPGPETTLLTWSGCPVGGTVEVWKGVGSMHIPNMTAAGEQAIVNFLSTHPKP